MEKFLKRYFRSHQHLLELLIPATFIVLGLILFLVYRSTRPVSLGASGVESLSKNEVTETSGSDTLYTLPINGEQVTDRSRIDDPVNAFVISNSVEARPQSGLTEAEIVFEFLAESNVTRFVALYQGDIPEDIGPMRSLRTYFSDIALSFDANLSHVGGDPKALSEISSLGVKSMDEFSFENYYYRATDRFAPHNLYSTGEFIEKLNTDTGRTESNFNPWLRSKSPETKGNVATELTVNLPSSAYSPTYKYNESTKQYPRSLNGSQQLNREDGEVIAPNVVITLKASHTVLDSDGHLGIDLVGDGDAIVFQEGKAVEGKWIRTSRNSEFKFVDNQGEEIKLAIGMTWVNVLPIDSAVSYF